MNLYRITGRPAEAHLAETRLVAAETLVKAHKLSGFDDAAIAAVENMGELYAVALREEDLVQSVPDGRLLLADEIKASISPDGWTLRSFENGRLYKSLVLHLKAHGLTPQQYRVKWGLPPQYPMVAPAYSIHLSETAKGRGFGKNRKKKGTAK